AKVIAWGKDRDEAIRRMTRALNEFAIEGVKTTIPFHLKVLNHPRFVEGDVHIQFLETTNLDEERKSENE
ncbi:acetyl-CoA carboxylase biotin carboxylase subunit, partial [Clostridium boliviensis]|nr:acetyl-CoA carboxylase biotin carboxylase subunit [Clostridium boliviensis]